MPIWRMQCSFLADSALPRDRLTITPHFDSGVGGESAEELVNDLADALSDWWVVPAEVTVTAYDAQGSVPVYPAATTQRNPGVQMASSVPREVAVCLSYYSERNIPRSRGRLFIPYTVVERSTAGTGVDVRPNAVIRAKVGDLAQIFADLGGVSVDWVLYSRADDVGKPVSNWWVDDEWDTIRSRGLRATTRLTGTVGE